VGGRWPTSPSIGFQRATSGRRAVAKVAKLANKHALKCAAEIGVFGTAPCSGHEKGDALPAR
jgi:hypothetical protein